MTQRKIFIGMIVFFVCLFTLGSLLAQEPEVQLDSGQIDLDPEQSSQLNKIFLELQLLEERDAKLRAQQAMIEQAMILNGQELQEKDQERMEFLQSIGVREGEAFSVSPDFKTLIPRQEE